jgi:hypothetical protein
MPNYVPTSAPLGLQGLSEYLQRELRRVGDSLRDNADQVHYQTIPSNFPESLSAAVVANWKHSNSNIVRISTSNTLTITGIADRTHNRVRTYLNIGSGVLVIKSEAAESSASNRFLLVDALWNLSANGAATVWYDPFASRHRGISRT